MKTIFAVVDIYGGPGDSDLFLSLWESRELAKAELERASIEDPGICGEVREVELNKPDGCLQ